MISHVFHLVHLVEWFGSFLIFFVRSVQKQSDPLNERDDRDEDVDVDTVLNR